MIATRQVLSIHRLMRQAGTARAFPAACVAGGAWLVSFMVLTLSIAALLLAPIAQAQANISTELSSYKLGVGDVITAQVVGDWSSDVCSSDLLTNNLRGNDIAYAQLVAR